MTSSSKPKVLNISQRRLRRTEQHAWKIRSCFWDMRADRQTGEETANRQTHKEVNSWWMKKCGSYGLWESDLNIMIYSRNLSVFTCFQRLVRGQSVLRLYTMNAVDTTKTNSYVNFIWKPNLINKCINPCSVFTRVRVYCTCVSNWNTWRWKCYVFSPVGLWMHMTMEWSSLSYTIALHGISFRRSK